MLYLQPKHMMADYTPIGFLKYFGHKISKFVLDNSKFLGDVTKIIKY